MTQLFTLSRMSDIVPNDGERVAHLLATAAQEASRKLGAQPNAADPIARRHVAQLFYLAADAFECAASASIGHGRTWRCQQYASECIAQAKECCAPIVDTVEE